MKEIILTILQAVLLAAISAATPFVVSFFKAKREEILEKIQNDKLKRYFAELSDAVTTAVAFVSQTYVDALKEENMFTKDAQLEALEKAKYTALGIITPAAQEFLESIYGDLDELLAAYIEKEVKAQKSPLASGELIIE